MTAGCRGDCSHHHHQLTEEGRLCKELGSERGGLADGGQQDRAGQPRSLRAGPIEREEGGLSIYKLKKY